jgi:hypothetical protein
MRNKKIDIPVEPAKVINERKPLDWLSTPDVMRSILNSLACIYYHEGNKELRKENSDQDRIKELAALQKDARNAFHNRGNYSSLDRMDEVIAHYGSIIREIRQRPADPNDIEKMKARALKLFNEGEISKEGYEYIMEAYSD